MTVYTSSYRGEVRGKGISISLYPAINWKGKHLPLLASTSELFKWWKSSAQDAEAKKRVRALVSASCSGAAAAD